MGRSCMDSNWREPQEKPWASDPSTDTPVSDLDIGATQDDSQSELFASAIASALDLGDLRAARTIIAQAEAEYSQHTAPDRADNRAQIDAAKARIAIADGDGPAARAILIRAIERAPDHGQLRSLMSEVMMASGRATDVRPVLTHLGKDPSYGGAPEKLTQKLTKTPR